MKWLPNPRLLLALVLALAIAWPLSLWQASNRGETAGRAAVQQAWDAAITTQAQATLRLVNAAHATSQSLQDKASEQRKATNDQITRINRAHALALERLRDRPERPNGADLPEVAGTGQAASGCTGAGLFRSDSAVLIGLGRDADELRINLKSCYSTYDAAREALK